MAPSQALVLSRGSTCYRCLFAYATRISPIQRRGIAQKYLQKTAEAEAQWKERAELIKEGKVPNLWDILEERGYVKDTAGSKETIRELMRIRRIGAYVGVDPSASSMHVGHLVPLMPLFWMYMHGYKAFTVLGGSTVKIGDPTDRLKDRDAIGSADLAMNLTKIHFQMKKLWLNVEEQARRYGYKKEWAWRRGLVNNNTWWNKLPMLEVLKRVGRHMRVGAMLSRETVKRKMTEGDGVSFGEFTYPIMQGWDWWELFRRQHIQMQIGGSDQYGNIITGIDIVKAARDNEPDPSKKIPALSELDDPVGFTVPLLTDSSGAKFGKSAGNAVWLDPLLTSPFDLYGYFVRRPDADVESLLKLLTFLPMSEIQKIMAEQNQDPSKRVAHHRLAYEVLSLVHSEKQAQETQQEHREMYSRGGAAIPLLTRKAPEPDDYAEPEGPVTPHNAPRIDMILPESLIKHKSIGRILYAAGFAESATKGHKLALQEAVYIGGLPGRQPGYGQAMDPERLTWNPVKLWFPQETQKYLIEGKLLILRKGKHNLRVIKMVSDEEYMASGLSYPGQGYRGVVRRLRTLLKDLKDGAITPEEARELLRREAVPQEEELTETPPWHIEFPKEKNQAQQHVEKIIHWELGRQERQRERHRKRVAALEKKEEEE